MLTKNVVGIYVPNEPELFERISYFTQKEFPGYTVQINGDEKFLKIDHTRKMIIVGSFATVNVDVMFNIISLNETALATVERYIATILNRGYTYEANQLLLWIMGKLGDGRNLIIDAPVKPITEDVEGMQDNSLIDNSLIEEINTKYGIDVVKTYLELGGDSRNVNKQSTQQVGVGYYELKPHDEEPYVTDEDELFVERWGRGRGIVFHISYIQIGPYKFSRKHLKPITYRGGGKYMNLEKENGQSVYYYPNTVYEEICYCEGVLPITKEIVEEILRNHVDSYSMLLALLGINNGHYVNDKYYSSNGSNVLKLSNKYVMNDSIITVGPSVMCEALFIYP